jgi:glycosyltransferase involved in cell wall biosynthesis
VNLAILVTGIEKPSARHRILQFIPFLHQNNFQAEVFVIPGNHLDRIRFFRKLRAYDIVFLQRKLFTAIELNILRRNAQKLVYDFDDAVMFRDSVKRTQYSSLRTRKFIRTIKNADIVIAGNEYLRDQAISYNSQTFIIPTTVDTDVYKDNPASPSSDAVILGWLGSKATLFYLENIKNVFETIFERFPNVSLKIVADRFFDCNKMPVIKKRWEYEDETDDLHTFDIGLMPLTDDPWSRGKCGFKLLQYMAAGIPPVCSPVGVNKEIVQDGINGFYARDEHEWVEKLSNLILDRQLRYRIGRNARLSVLDNYSKAIHEKRLLTLLSSLRT